jgi:predicted MPP superfamily phosphohydrolase
MSWFLRMILLVLPAIMLVYTYVSWRLVAALGQLTSWPRTRIRRGVWAVAGYLIFYPLLLTLATFLGATAVNDAFASGQLWTKILFVFPFWLGLVIVVELLPLLLVIDLSRFVLRPLFKKYQSLWMKPQACATVSLVAIIMVYAPARIVNDTYSVRLAAHEMKIKNLPNALEGFRIVQLSDLQADPYTDEKKMQSYIDRANSQNPDLIVFCGDLVTRGAGYISRGAQMMGRLQARLGVYACLGDHDYWANPQAVAQQLKANHVTTLEDSVLTLAASPSKISLTILTNVYNRRPSLQTLDRLRRQRNNDAAFHLILSHQQNDELIQFAEKNDYHLLLAGHTHGGQVVFKPFGIPLCVSQTETRYYSGFYQIGNLHLSVTNGLGLTFAPFRYQAPAEVTLIVLKRKS